MNTFIIIVLVMRVLLSAIGTDILLKAFLPHKMEQIEIMFNISFY